MRKWFPELRTLLRMSHDMDAMVSVVDRAWNEVLPTSYVLDRDGKVHARLQGGKDAAAFEAAFLPLLNGALASESIPDKAQAASGVR
ncbi:MAG: hypothetical protein R3F24_05085 [Gammaproteobacteria bacterium]